MIALWIVGGLFALVVLLALVGACLPRGHVATSAVRLKAAPDDVWSVAADLARWPEWAPAVKAMERLPDVDGKPAWTMRSRHGATPTVVETFDPPRRLVTRITDDSLPYGGSWIWEIAPDGAGSRVAITEDGFVKNPVFRALATLVFGHHATQEAYLRALAKRLGEDAPTVERVR